MTAAVNLQLQGQGISFFGFPFKTSCSHCQVYFKLLISDLFRFKCKVCDNFDFCERCFYSRKAHKHSFNRVKNEIRLIFFKFQIKHQTQLSFISSSFWLFCLDCWAWQSSRICRTSGPSPSSWNLRQCKRRADRRLEPVYQVYGSFLTWKLGLQAHRRNGQLLAELWNSR